MACLGVLLLAQVASAQSVPDAKALLERETTALDAFSSYRYEEAMTVTVTAAGMPVDVQMTSSVAGANPGKRRVATKMAGMDMQIMVSNGKDMWMFVPILNQYLHVSGDSADAAALAGVGGGLPGVSLTDLARAGGNEGMAVKVLRSERITVDSTAHDCWVVESRSEQLGVPGTMELRNVVSTSWLDQSTGLLLRRTMTGTMAEGALPVTGDVKMESNRRGFAFNEPVSDSLFVFTPPAGATEMSLDGLAGLTGGAAAPVQPAIPPAPRRKSAVLPAGEPQAFIPLLHPITHIEPVWPAEAKQMEGSVELLVTIDEQGTVTDAEALSGPPALRPAAIAAAKQMQFRPVIRAGHPVAAYTMQTVDFMDWSLPSHVPLVNMADDLAAAQRQMTLSQAWPRSKAQVLADYENDLEGTDPSLQQAFLPQLAKAAIDAGEIDKAERYANEALGVTSPVPDDGTAVHDAHLVLGRVAMTRQEIDLAKLHLREAGKTTGGPVLSSFGPDLTLAQQLLDAGQRATVLEYLTRCETFWISGRPQLQKWEAAIRAGERPHLNQLGALLGGAGLEIPDASPASVAVPR
jgi:TonB family protein